MQPTVPASRLLGVHLRQSTAFLFLLPSLPRPQPFCPVPSLASWPSSQSGLRVFPETSLSLWAGFRRPPKDKQSLCQVLRHRRLQLSKKPCLCTWQEKKAANATPEIFNTLRVICPPITRSRFSATCTQCCKDPETFSALSCDLATRLFTCLPAGPGHRISCPDIDRAIKSR